MSYGICFLVSLGLGWCLWYNWCFYFGVVVIFLIWGFFSLIIMTTAGMYHIIYKYKINSFKWDIVIIRINTLRLLYLNTKLTTCLMQLCSCSCSSIRVIHHPYVHKSMFSCNPPHIMIKRLRVVYTWYGYG